MVLNSQFYRHRENVESYARGQDDFLEKELAVPKEARRHLVMFQHVPWFQDSLDEDYNIFNVDKPVRRQMLDKLNKHGVRNS